MSTYSERKENGLCITCGRTNDTQTVRCSSCRERYRAHNRRYKHLARDTGLCSSCRKVPVVSEKSVCQACMDRITTNRKKNYHFDKDAAIVGYGGECRCCGNHNHRVLQLDHVNNDGKQHRQELKTLKGITIWRWAVQNGFPLTLQLLCANCHHIKTRYGGCIAGDHD